MRSVINYLLRDIFLELFIIKKEIHHMATDIESMNAAFDNLSKEVSEAVAKFVEISDELIAAQNANSSVEEYTAAVEAVTAKMSDLASELDTKFGTSAPAQDAPVEPTEPATDDSSSVPVSDTPPVENPVSDAPSQSDEVSS